ncbi:MAG: hypothetical protein ACRERE_21655 [Candidatus Entotheonellia bacterium]
MAQIVFDWSAGHRHDCGLHGRAEGSRGVDTRHVPLQDVPRSPRRVETPARPPRRAPAPSALPAAAS